jgi:hypothetical protein
VRDEETFIRRTLWPLTRPNDLLDRVARKSDPIESDPVFR